MLISVTWLWLHWNQLRKISWQHFGNTLMIGQSVKQNIHSISSKLIYSLYCTRQTSEIPRNQECSAKPRKGNMQFSASHISPGLRGDSKSSAYRKLRSFYSCLTSFCYDTVFTQNQKKFHMMNSDFCLPTVTVIYNLLSYQSGGNADSIEKSDNGMCNTIYELCRLVNRLKQTDIEN